MVQRVYCKCKFCEKTTMIKYQVGFDDFNIIYTCPNCLAEIKGSCTNDEKHACVNFSFENAEEVNQPKTPDYFLLVSREFPTLPIKPYDESCEYALSPFMLFAFQTHKLTDKSQWKRAGFFVDHNLKKKNEIFDLVKLWLNDKSDILSNNLKKELPLEIFPLNNKSEIYRGLRNVFVNYISTIIPENWMSEKNTFDMLSYTLKANSNALMTYISKFEENNEFLRIERKLYQIMELFLTSVSGILPAFLLLDCPDIASNAKQYAISTISFDSLLDFYQKSYEVIVDSATVLIALNNIRYRHDFDVLPNNSKKSFSDRLNDSNKYMRMKECLDETECFSELVISMPLNRVRNSIGHFSTEFEGMNQLITFKDSHKEEQLYLIEFALLCINNFHTCFYLSEILYQLRKWYRVFLKGDVPYLPPFENLSSKKIPRNSPCPCGSGKKYKKCCGFPKN